MGPLDAKVNNGNATVGLQSSFHVLKAALDVTDARVQSEALVWNVPTLCAHFWI